MDVFVLCHKRGNRFEIMKVFKHLDVATKFLGAYDRQNGVSPEDYYYLVRTTIFE